MKQSLRVTLVTVKWLKVGFTEIFGHNMLLPSSNRLGLLL